MRYRPDLMKIAIVAVAGLAFSGFGSGFAGSQPGRELQAGAAVQPAQAAAQTMSFEVASIKPSEGDGRMVRIRNSPGGRYTAEGVTLKMLIQQAYDVKDFQISGGPGWLSTAAFDINAKAEDPNVGGPQIRLMLQSMLAERFKLKFHRETKELPVYALLVGKNGHKMKVSEFQPGSEGTPPEAPKIGAMPPGAAVRGGGAGAAGGYAVAGAVKPGGAMMTMGPGQITAQGAPMGALVNILAQQLGRPVIDKTELQGNFDIKLEWAPDAAGRGQAIGGGGEAPPAGDSTGPSVFTAIQEQLGLRLEAQKGPVEALVIDFAEKPSGN
jgi:uncharacterized protein (TIGR03435 family)